MKSDKMPYIIYADIESLIKKQMNVQIISEILQQQKQMNIFLANIQCQQFGQLITERTNIIYTAEKDCMKKFCTF